MPFSGLTSSNMCAVPLAEDARRRVSSGLKHSDVISEIVLPLTNSRTRLPFPEDVSNTRTYVVFSEAEATYRASGDSCFCVCVHSTDFAGELVLHHRC